MYWNRYLCCHCAAGDGAPRGAAGEWVADRNGLGILKKSMAIKRGKRAEKENLGSAVQASSNRDLLVLLLFILMVLFAIYVAAAFLIHFFTWSSDQSLAWADLWADSDVYAANWMGTFGATLAALCVSRGFGVGALFIPVMLAMLAVLVLGVKVKDFYRRMLMMAVGMVVLSVGFGYLFNTAGGYLGSGLGGDYGLFVGRWLVVRLGYPLAGVLLATVAFGYFMWVSRGFNGWIRSRAHSDARRVRGAVEGLFGGARRDEAADGGAFQEEQAKVDAAGAEEAVDQMETCESVDGDEPQEAPGVPAERADGTGDEVPTEFVGYGEGDEAQGDGSDEGIKSTPVEKQPRATADGDSEAQREQPNLESDFGVEPTKGAEPDSKVAQIATPIAVEGEAAEEEEESGEALEPAAAPVESLPGRGAEEEEQEPEVATTVVEAAAGSPAGVGCYTADGHYDPNLELPGYQFPPIDLLDDHSEGQQKATTTELIEKRTEIIKALRTYNIEIANIKIIQGPTVTLYEIVLKKGILIKRIKSLEDDIAMSLSALSVRIIAPIPGRGTVGIEVPNAHPSIVSMKSVINSSVYEQSKAILPVAIGRTISNQVYVFDLAKMPHLLVAGATGQGKSVGLNAIITSLLYRKHPSQLKFVFVDPKKVELSLYSKLERHYLAKIPGNGDAIITDVDLVVETLSSLCNEMDSRYELLKDAMVRNIVEYNEKFVSGRLDAESGHRYLPYIVVVIDEYADLIMTAGRDVEQPIARLAQLARAIGIHLVIATQRPTANIITGMIKANFPARIAFRVSSAVDSRTIIDQSGANQLIGRGDMLISIGTELVRLQCAFLDMPELERITDFISNQQGYADAYSLPDAVSGGIEEFGGEAGGLSDRDGLFEDVARMVVDEGRCSTSAIQRKYSIGYNRAGRIVDQLEAAGIVGAQEASKPRAVLIGDRVSLERVLADL